jgi:hypothetical protein
LVPERRGVGLPVKRASDCIFDRRTHAAPLRFFGWDRVVQKLLAGLQPHSACGGAPRVVNFEKVLI